MNSPMILYLLQYLENLILIYNKIYVLGIKIFQSILKFSNHQSLFIARHIQLYLNKNRSPSY
jgi:hypothetical protein